MNRQISLLNEHKMINYFSYVKDSALYAGLDNDDIEQWMSYFHSITKNNTLSDRQHVIALYDPFAKRDKFPAGRRFCVNVYTGCGFGCKYCYAQKYIKNHHQPRAKSYFRKKLTEDLIELSLLKLDAVPLHVSNSTDCAQYIENKHKDTLYLLKKLIEYRHLFTSITFLTKNPSMFCNEDYLQLLCKLKDKVYVEVSCAYSNDSIRKQLEPMSPSIIDRLNAVKVLTSNDIRVALRIDPIFPRDPLPIDKKLSDYGLLQVQYEHGLRRLAEFAIKYNCHEIITSPLKLVGKYNFVSSYRSLYRDLNSGKDVVRGGSFRYPTQYYKQWIQCLLDETSKSTVDVSFCKKSLLAKR